jgi:hypothetical protein
MCACLKRTCESLHVMPCSVGGPHLHPPPDPVHQVGSCLVHQLLLLLLQLLPAPAAMPLLLPLPLAQPSSPRNRCQPDAMPSFPATYLFVSAHCFLPLACIAAGCCTCHYGGEQLLCLPACWLTRSRLHVTHPPFLGAASRAVRRNLSALTLVLPCAFTTPTCK